MCPDTSRADAHFPHVEAARPVASANRRSPDLRPAAALADGIDQDARRNSAPPSPRLRPDRSAGVRQQLRDATAAVHEALHHHPGFVSLLERRITLAEYRALLARLYGFHLPLERGLRTASRRILGEFNVHALERSPALRADLQSLGMSDGEIDALPLFDDLRPVRSHAELMGRLYVVEGSALGGRVLASRLDGLLGPDGTEARQFFTGRAAPDPLPWSAFCKLLEGQGVPSRIDEVIESAETTFRGMAHWLIEGEADV